MAKIGIITDSASDIPVETVTELGIRVLPIPITHKGITYSERVEYTNEEFYELMLGSKEIPSTSHITAETYISEYKKLYDDGFSQILNVTINSLGSNMFEAACLAKMRFLEEFHLDSNHFRIEVIDSKTYTMAYGIAVINAAKMAQRGIELDVIIEYLEDWFDRLELLFSVYSLDFVKKSGRVLAAAAFVGELMGFRPFILFRDGVSTIVDKARGDKNVIQKMAEVAKKRMSEPGKYPFLIIRGTPVSEALELESLIHDISPEINIDGIYSVGASVAINSGPKVIAMVYAGEKRGK